MSQADQDKTEQPTPYRLEEARKRGEVAKSPDVVGALVTITFAVVLTLTAGNVAASLATATRQMIGMAGNAPLPGAGLAGWVLHLYAPVVQALTPLVLALVVAAVLGNVLQTGPVFSTHPLKPDFKRMHPAQVLKRIFSFRSLWELAKLLLKTTLLLGIGVLFLWRARALAEASALTLPQRFGSVLLGAFSRTSLYVLLALGLVAILDLLFVRREYMRKMRMSRRELKDEVKRRDGDPTVKSKQKQQIRELLKKTRALGRVREADMIVTNPTHVAVALRYRPGETLAPVVLAKGAGLLARQIRQLGARHQVPLLPAPPLARALYRECEIEGLVPQSHYAALAPLYQRVWALRGGIA
jgi:flagellar biosynthetic protein FlhB